MGSRMTESVVHRARCSQWRAVPMDEADGLVFQKTPRGDTVEVDVRDVQWGDVIACDVLAAYDVPALRTSIKDGYAVRASDGAGARRVVGASTAGGQLDTGIVSGECARISTGAAVPAGADAVVMVEKTELKQHDGKEELVIEILEAVKEGQDIRNPGSDIRAGSVVMYRGTVVRSAELGILAGCGREKVEINERVRVGLISTGNEVLDRSTLSIPPAGCLVDTNRPQLRALLEREGVAVVDGGIVGDTRASLVASLSSLLKECRIVVSSGGVSMGEKDLLKTVLQEELGFEIHFGRVWMKPGLPSTFATGVFDGRVCAVLALPGNPASSWVCAHLFALPAIRRFMRREHTLPRTIRVKLSSPVKLDTRPEFRRACLDIRGGEAWAIDTGNQLSSRLLSLYGANLLLRLPSGEKGDEKREGEEVDALVVGDI